MDTPKLHHRIRQLATLMDSAYRIPGTNWRFGIDGIIGLIPGIGDAVGAMISSYIIFLASKAGAPPVLVIRMLVNVSIDFLLGLIPFLGDFFDFAWKANMRNTGLLHDYLTQRKKTIRQSALILASQIVVLLALVVGIIWAFQALIGWIVSAANN